MKDFSFGLEEVVSSGDRGVVKNIPLLRATQTTSTLPDLVHLGAPFINKDFSGSRYSILDKLGVRKITDKAFTRWHITKLGDAEFVAELTGPTNDTTIEAAETGETQRCIVVMTMSKELIGPLGTIGFLEGVLHEEALKAFDRALFKKIVQTAEAVTAKIGFGSTAADSAFTLANALDFESDLAAYEGAPLSWVGSTEVKEKLKQSPIVSGGERMLWQFDQMIDLQAVSTKYFSDSQTLILGDWSQFYVKVPDEIQIIIDNYSGSDKGDVKITFAGLFGVGLIDSGAMIVGKNIDIS